MFATVEIDVGRAAALRHAAADGDRLQSLRQHGLSSSTTRARTPKGEPQLVARQTFVTTGATRGDQVAVLTGVKDGDTVVTAGQIKLHNGSPVHDQQRGAADATIPIPTPADE